MAEDSKLRLLGIGTGPSTTKWIPHQPKPSSGLAPTTSNKTRLSGTPKSPTPSPKGWISSSESFTSPKFSLSACSTPTTKTPATRPSLYASPAT
ncbi:hypothetical protein DSO57_1031227 [Entomophthora muscae]|uniref:Uncharacterized protein n=1 Tax=Entomophthora muscae TaxID=34485 RepID=A0ACC2TN39_9FUNG|nr:hypothetical protein DSO57_1031227 [Entomophthora muscae]